MLQGIRTLKHGGHRRREAAADCQWRRQIRWTSLYSAATGLSADAVLIVSGGFTVIDGQQRRLHDHANTLGFSDLHSYLEARCRDDASLAQLAGELDTTVHVVWSLLDQAGIHRSPRPARSARHRRHATDQRLTKRGVQLGFASLQAYLADRVAEQAWPIGQVADELGMHRDTVRDRLDRYGLRYRR